MLSVSVACTGAACAMRHVDHDILAHTTTRHRS